VKLESALVLTLSVLKLSLDDNGRESLFRCETPVVERSTSGFRIAPSHLAFTEPALLRAAATFSVTSPLAVKPHRLRAWRSHVHNRVRIRSSSAAVVSFLLLGTAARIHAGRFQGATPRASTLQPRRRPFLLPVAFRKLLGAAAATCASLAAAAMPGVPTGATACGSAAAASKNLGAAVALYVFRGITFSSSFIPTAEIRRDSKQADGCS
jgi:hypothetical protein